MDITPDTPLSAFPGVGKTRQRALEKLGLRCAGDLLTYYPRRYEDRTQVYSIAQAPIGEAVCVRAMVANRPTLSHIRRGLDLVKLRVVDDAAALDLTFFNQSYVKDALQPGETYTFYGKVDLQLGRRQMTNPTFEAVGHERHTGRIFPRYPLTQGLTNNLLADLCDRAVPACLDSLPETLPQAVRTKYVLQNARWSCREVHSPTSWDALADAKRRLAFEELYYLTLGLGLLRDRRADVTGPALPTGDPQDFRALLPFTLTGAQRRVIDACAQDLARPKPMNRLCQGDVGSGKTAVAAFCLWRCAKSGAQAALMAPTDLLARQHYETLSRLLAPAGIRVALLTASLPAPEKKRVRDGLRSGDIQVAVGTHALFTKDTLFHDLALAVVDEQHRFGVDQRSALAAKGRHPHLLVLSATPIPRTLALILYGDLDVSILNELPPGRRPVETFLVGEALRPRLYKFVDKLVAQGRQVYMVCPAVEEDDTGLVDLRSVKEHARQLQTQVFPHLRVEFVHGQMKPADKERVMSAFVAGEVDVLVATTVIEVGVDVPNAALMVVENADRFGLSQLHQLRGRVGRGAHQSYCVLVSGAQNPDTRARLKALCATTDGFQIAEADLKQRGPGDFFGSRQSGLPQLRSADLWSDMSLLTDAQAAARATLDADPGLSGPENAPLLAQVRRLFSQHPGVFN